MKFPIRHSNHSLEQESESFLRAHIPTEWSINSVVKDYGQDFNIEISEEGTFRGLDLIIQLKSSEQSDASQDYERQTLNLSTYNYLYKNVRVAMIIKYVKVEREAYWIILSQIERPNQENQSFTVHIPRSNKLSTIDWDQIKTYVKQVTDTKLEAWPPKKQE